MRETLSRQRLAPACGEPPAAHGSRAIKARVPCRNSSGPGQLCLCGNSRLVWHRGLAFLRRVAGACGPSARRLWPDLRAAPAACRSWPEPVLESDTYLIVWQIPGTLGAAAGIFHWDRTRKGGMPPEPRIPPVRTPFVQPRPRCWFSIGFPTRRGIILIQCGPIDLVRAYPAATMTDEKWLWRPARPP
jgi:hypothetical protein